MIDTPGLDEATISGDHRWAIIKRKANEEKVRRAFLLFRRNNVEPILIKGVAVAQYYPDSELRDSVDMDIAVADRDLEKAKQIILSPEATGLAIDLHCEMRFLDAVKWSDLFANSETLDLDGVEVRVPRPEDHLRVICTHWLADGGANRDRLRDIYYMTANRRAEFDWDRCLNVVDERRRNYVICALGAAEHFLGLDLLGTPAENASEKMPRWVLRTIEKEWASPTPFRPLFTETATVGQFFRQLRKRLPPNPITATILRGGDLNAKTRIFYQIGTIFDRIGPSIKNLSKSIFRSKR